MASDRRGRCSRASSFFCAALKTKMTLSGTGTPSPPPSAAAARRCVKSLSMPNTGVTCREQVTSELAYFTVLAAL